MKIENQLKAKIIIVMKKKNNNTILYKYFKFT